MNKQLSKREIKALLVDHACRGHYSGKEQKWYVTKYEPLNDKERTAQANVADVLVKHNVRFKIN